MVTGMPITAKEAKHCKEIAALVGPHIPEDYWRSKLGFLQFLDHISISGLDMVRENQMVNIFVSVKYYVLRVKAKEIT